MKKMVKKINKNKYKIKWNLEIMDYIAVILTMLLFIYFMLRS